MVQALESLPPYDVLIKSYINNHKENNIFIEKDLMNFHLPCVLKMSLNSNNIARAVPL